MVAALYGPWRAYAAPMLRGDRLQFVLLGVGVIMLAVAILALVTGRRPAKTQPPPITRPRLLEQDEDEDEDSLS